MRANVEEETVVCKGEPIVRKYEQVVGVAQGPGLNRKYTSTSILEIAG